MRVRHPVEAAGRLVTASGKDGRPLRRRLANLFQPGAEETAELRRELAETRQRLTLEKDQSKHWKENAEVWKEAAKRWRKDAKHWKSDASRWQEMVLGQAQARGPASRPACVTGEASSYLDLMKRTVSGWVYADANILDEQRSGVDLREQDGGPGSFDSGLRAQGADWPERAHTMIGLRRLDNLQSCIEDVLANDVPGDLIETGVWRGGATILMRAVLKAYGVEDRLVWAADSFEGVPPPRPGEISSRYRQPVALHTYDELAVSLEQVKSNFERYGLLDDQVRFLEGRFRDSLPDAPMERLAIVRLDGDMYESTMDGLVHLYPKLSVGGYLIVDDYGALPRCRQAVHDYREAHGVQEEIRPIDWSGVFWQRTE